MLAMPEIHHIKHLRAKKGLSLSEIVRRTGFNWRTVWLDFTINPILVFCSLLIFRKLTKKKILNNRVHVFLPMQLIIMLISMMLLIFDYNMKTNLLIRPLNLYIFALTISCVFVAVMYKFSDIFKTKFYF